MKKLFIVLMFLFLISFVVSESSTITTIFDIRPDGICINGYWWGDGEVYDTLVDEGWCAVGNCCPENYICEGDESDALCVFNDVCEDIGSCSDYENPTTCEEDDCGKGSSRNVCGGYRLIDEACGEIIRNYIGDRQSCACFWDEDDEVCKQTQEVLPTTYNSIDVSGMYVCEVDVQTSDCVNGVMTMEKNVATTWDSSVSEDIKTACQDQLCAGATKQISCGEALVKLPFFSWINIVIVCLGLGLFYFLRRK